MEARVRTPLGLREGASQVAQGGKYDGLLRRHILPRFDRVELGRLSVTAVRAWYHELKTGSRTARQPDDAYRARRAATELLALLP